MTPHTPIRKLARTYEPILRFSVEENYYPLNVVDYVRRCSLYDEDGATPVVPEGKVTLRGLSRRYADDPSYYLKIDPISLRLTSS